jgi:hypothetical protein
MNMECDGYFNNLFQSDYKFKSREEYDQKVFPEQPPEDMLDWLYKEITKNQNKQWRQIYERDGVIDLIQRFKEDKAAWLEFYKKARTLHLYVLRNT